MLLLLSQRIIVKESRWTWTLEQQIRLESTLAWFSYVGDFTVKEFFDTYNRSIELLVNYSQLGHSKYIIQPPSTQERQFFSLMEEGSLGVPDLLEERPENFSAINRLMAYLHGAK